MKLNLKHFVLSLALTTGVLLPVYSFAEIPDDVNDPSLFFTSEELNQIYQANDGKIDPSIEAKDTRSGDNPEAVQIVDPGPRVLKLAGIIYHGESDWVIWFNGERVTQKTIPQNVLGLIVRKEKIALRWFDRGTNRIINLVLLPHQEYHIDTDTITLGTN